TSVKVLSKYMLAFAGITTRRNPEIEIPNQKRPQANASSMNYNKDAKTVRVKFEGYDASAANALWEVSKNANAEGKIVHTGVMLGDQKGFEKVGVVQDAMLAHGVKITDLEDF